MLCDSLCLKGNFCLGVRIRIINGGRDLWRSSGLKYSQLQLFLEIYYPSFKYLQRWRNSHCSWTPLPVHGYLCCWVFFHPQISRWTLCDDCNFYALLLPFYFAHSQLGNVCASSLQSFLGTTVLFIMSLLLVRTLPGLKPCSHLLWQREALTFGSGVTFTCRAVQSPLTFWDRSIKRLRGNTDVLFLSYGSGWQLLLCLADKRIITWKLLKVANFK